MNLGGPVWHASVMSHRGLLIRPLVIQAAERVLAGVGDPALGEWREWGNRTFHLRRRLTGAEAVAVGPVVDVRGTPEAGERIQQVWPWLHLVPAEMIRTELEGP